MTIRGSGPAARRDLRCRPVLHLHAEDPGGAPDDRPEVLVGVEVEPVDRPEPVAERPADPPGARGCAHDRERTQREAEAPRARPLADHHVEGEVLHRGIEDLLHRPVEAVDLVDEEDVPVVERRQDRREVPCPLDGRAGRIPDIDAEFPRDDRRERGLAEAWRPVEEDVIRRLPALPGGLEQHGEPCLHLALAEILAQAVRSQGALRTLLDVVEKVRGDETRSFRHAAQNSMNMGYSYRCSTLLRAAASRAARVHRRPARRSREPRAGSRAGPPCRSPGRPHPAAAPVSRPVHRPRARASGS